MLRSIACEIPRFLVSNGMRIKTSMYSVYTNNIINVHVRDYISGKIGFAIER